MIISDYVNPFVTPTTSLHIEQQQQTHIENQMKMNQLQIYQ